MSLVMSSVMSNGIRVRGRHHGAMRAHHDVQQSSFEVWGPCFSEQSKCYRASVISAARSSQVGQGRNPPFSFDGRRPIQKANTGACLASSWTAAERGKQASPSQPGSAFLQWGLFLSSITVMHMQASRNRDQGARPLQQPQATSAGTDASGTGPEQPPSKRRKHDGVRFGPRPQATAAPVPRDWQQQTTRQASSVNHVHNERKLAEAQLHGRKFQLDTNSCTVPKLGELFKSEAWSLSDMMDAKKALNDTKDLLDAKDIK